jgi:hypothetical protein
VPEGHLPVFSVGSEKEAKHLLTLACQTNLNGDYVARELAETQTVKPLMEFAKRLEYMHDTYIVNSGRCECDAHS